MSICDAEPGNDILIAEDDAGLLRLVTKNLRRQGFQTTGVSSGSEVLKEVTSNEYTLLLMDYKLKDMTGKDLVERLSRKNISLPFIVMTGQGDEKIAVEMMKLGARDYLIKDSRFMDMISHVVKNTVRRIAIETKLGQSQSELQKINRELYNKKLMFEAILEGTMAGYWDWHIQDEYEYLSPSFKKMLGYEEHELPDHPDSWQKIIHPDDLPRVFEGFEKHVKSKGQIPLDIQVRYYHKDGSIVWVARRGKVVEWDENEEPVRMVGSHVDITKMKEAEGLLNRQALDLMRSNTELEHFAYVASHDLQEPLRKIASFAELFEKKYCKRADETGRKYIHYVVDGARRMQALIQALLAYSRVDRQQYFEEKIDLNQLFKEIITDLDHPIAEAGATVTQEELPTITGSPAHIRQLFQNLLSNALKFRRHEDHRVHISALQQGDWVEIRIEDNGIGIEPQFHERIFQIFQRLHTREEYPGTGIGLAICKRIAERHGGRIWFESTPALGTTFFITLPHKPGPQKVEHKPAFSTPAHFESEGVLALPQKKEAEWTRR